MNGARRAILALVMAVMAAPVWAATFDDPEWPCIQRRVDEIAMFQMWPAAMPEGDWREDERIEHLAAAIAPRRVGMEEVEARVADWLATVPEAEREEKAGQLFNAVLDMIQRERQQVISGIGRYARSQAALSDEVEELQNQLVQLDAAEEKDMDRIEELEDELAWETRVYRERAQSLQYVCETPVLLEQRAFALARLIAGML